MTIYLGTDHAGYDLKEVLKEFLISEGFTIEDMGAFAHNLEDDYPEFIRPVAAAISEEPENRRGIILGGSGQGEAMVANRFPGVRATVYYGGQPEIISLSREHNNANILSLGARFISEEEARRVVREWLELPFGNEERHVRRIAAIDSNV